MFIMTQEKDTIVNTATVKTIHIVPPATSEQSFEIVAGLTDYSNVTIGRFKRREDASEILKFICASAADTEGATTLIPTEEEMKHAQPHKVKVNIPLSGDGIPPFMLELLKQMQKEGR